ncbi:hypothetical protein [Desulfotomaculum copahuensis]|uniref:N-formylglutamate amidohydrolase n=1 Tax=Desulfotomaculum copahuensis TaxID=1838280 RepID=A0A1B7LG05_9FIRM|nr:hypothetical protein [Desulfotomaculum copahuensis]OAT83671.1 hypothetical protein A6M21_07485 [Desulfotomaculum copahuensis]
MVFTEGRFVKYWLGNGELRAHVDAVHATSPKADLYTAEIVAGVARLTGCACIIATVSRTEADLNRPPSSSNREAIEEYRQVIREILSHCRILNERTGLITAPYLHLAIHGMVDNNHGRHAIEIGTCQGNSCSEDVREWLYGSATALAKEILPAETSVIMDRYFVGNESKAFHRLGDGKRYEGYGSNFNTAQVEVSLTLRKEYGESIIHLLSQLVEEFNHAF